MLLLLFLLVVVNAVAVAVSVAVQDSEEISKCALGGALPRSAFSDMQIRHMSKSDRRVLSVSSVSDSAYCVTGERRHCGQTDIDRRDGLGGPPKRMMTKVEAACFCIGWTPFVAIRAKPTLIVVTAMSPPLGSIDSYICCEPCGNHEDQRPLVEPSLGSVDSKKLSRGPGGIHGDQRPPMQVSRLKTC